MIYYGIAFAFKAGKYYAFNMMMQSIIEWVPSVKNNTETLDRTVLKRIEKKNELLITRRKDQELFGWSQS